MLVRTPNQMRYPPQQSWVGAAKKRGETIFQWQNGHRRFPPTEATVQQDLESSHASSTCYERINTCFFFIASPHLLRQSFRSSFQNFLICTTTWLLLESPQLLESGENSEAVRRARARSTNPQRGVTEWISGASIALCGGRCSTLISPLSSLLFDTSSGSWRVASIEETYPCGYVESCWGLRAWFK